MMPRSAPAALRLFRQAIGIDGQAHVMASSAALARTITRAGSRSTDLVLHWLADRDLRDDAYRAYAYLRWLDDALDGDRLSLDSRLQLIQRVRRLLAGSGSQPAAERPSPEEELLIDLLRHERAGHPGLRSYLHRMMDVMEFDARRRGRLVSAQELAAYTRNLSRAVMDGLSYFVGHRVVYPSTPDRLLACTGAHIVHMLRDAAEDVAVGYYNVPREFLEGHKLSPHDLDAPGYHAWVRHRLDLARRCFALGRGYITSFRNLRVRLAGLAYCSRFESTLRSIEARQALRPEAQAAEATWRSVLVRSRRPRLDGMR